MKRDYDRDTAIEQLQRCGLRVNADASMRAIMVYDHNPPGLRAWGAIDYLRSKHGFTVERT